MKFQICVCPNCRTPKGVRLSSDFGIVYGWDDDYYTIAVVMLFDGFSGYLELYCMLFRASGAERHEAES